MKPESITVLQKTVGDKTSPIKAALPADVSGLNAEFKLLKDNAEGGGVTFSTIEVPLYRREVRKRNTSSKEADKPAAPARRPAANKD